MPKISDLPDLTNLDADDQLVVNDDSANTTKKMTLTKLKEWLQSLTSWISSDNIDYANSFSSGSAEDASGATINSSGGAWVSANLSVSVDSLHANSTAIINVQGQLSGPSSGINAALTVQVSGANTVAASNLRAVASTYNGAILHNGTIIITGLAAGTNTFALYARGFGGNINTSLTNRRISVVII